MGLFVCGMRGADRLHSTQKAHAVARKLPQRPLRGRWGSVSASEQILLQCDHDALPQVFEAAFFFSDKASKIPKSMDGAAIQEDPCAGP